MPYRRLPNTDQARLFALQTAAQKESEADYNEQVLSYKTNNEIRRFLPTFESRVAQYHQNFQSKVAANKKYKHVVQNARMYISHFIQVLNLAVIRGDIKREQKLLYKLDPDNHILPDLSSEEDLLVWGQNIIEGEQERTKQGGFPIYNPTISKVQVHYDIFKEYQISQQIRQKNVDRIYGDMTEIRQQADALILEIWNQVEEKFKDLLPYERYCRCKQYGVIYYYRSGEKHLSAETDKQEKERRKQQPLIPFN
jgi:hypothetical protein